MDFNLSSNLGKDAVFEKIATALKNENFTITEQDASRPWGGFFVIDESEAKSFSENFFPHLTISEIQITGKVSPKILVVAPRKRLSWQYHFRRSEIWKVVFGIVGVKTSLSDEEGEIRHLDKGTFIKMETGERHRLIGLDSWGIVAEIWQHSNPEHPSDEEDIVRLQDDFGR